MAQKSDWNPTAEEVSQRFDKIESKLKEAEDILTVEPTSDLRDLVVKAAVSTLKSSEFKDDFQELAAYMTEKYDDTPDEEINEPEYARYSDFMIRLGMFLLKNKIFAQQEHAHQVANMLAVVIIARHAESAEVALSNRKSSLNLEHVEAVLRRIILSKYDDFFPREVFDRVEAEKEARHYRG